MEWFSATYNLDASNTYNLLSTSPYHIPGGAPPDLRYRYIEEDVPYGLVPMRDLGIKTGISLPLMTAIIELTSTLNDSDYAKSGRSLEKLGLGRLSKTEIMDYLECGNY